MVGCLTSFLAEKVLFHVFHVLYWVNAVVSMFEYDNLASIIPNKKPHKMGLFIYLKI